MSTILAILVEKYYEVVSGAGASPVYTFQYFNLFPVNCITHGSVFISRQSQRNTFRIGLFSGGFVSISATTQPANES